MLGSRFCFITQRLEILFGNGVAPKMLFQVYTPILFERNPFFQE